MSSDLEKARTQAEAVERAVTSTLNSAQRARLWAGLNRYLAQEAVHQHRHQEQDAEQEAEQAERQDAGPGPFEPRSGRPRR